MANEIKIVANNLTYYRKEAGYTQLEIAEKLNYSDKSISKWERGDGMPDIFVLRQLAKLYGVSMDDFFEQDIKKPVTNKKKRHWYITGLSIVLAWIVAALSFTVLMIAIPDVFPWWLLFIYALLVSFIITTVFSSVWGKLNHQLIAISGLIWSTCLAAFLTVTMISPMEYTWLIFIAGIPVEILEIIWYFLRRNMKRRIREEREEKDAE